MILELKILRASDTGYDIDESKVYPNIISIEEIDEISKETFYRIKFKLGERIIEQNWPKSKVYSAEIIFR